jgi:hypothetical protein
VNALKDFAISPGHEHASTRQMAQIDLAFRSVGKPDPDSVATEWLNFDCFRHS